MNNRTVVVGASFAALSSCLCPSHNLSLQLVLQDLQLLPSWTGYETINNSQQGGNVYVQENDWLYTGNADVSCSLGSTGYCVPLVILEQGEISVSGSYWCEDSAGTGDSNGPSMAMQVDLTTPGHTGIQYISPSGSWPDTTSSITVQLRNIGPRCKRTYTVPSTEGDVNQVTAYQNFKFANALNDLGCDQSAYYWDWGGYMYSDANSGSYWPKTSLVLADTMGGNFWNTLLTWPLCNPCSEHPTTGITWSVTGTG